jgi:hypothetical protein
LLDYFIVYRYERDAHLHEGAAKSAICLGETMSLQLVEVELIEDSLKLAALSAAVRSKGETLVCQRCMNEDEVIAGVLVIEATDEQWALCGPCWREMPQGAFIV